MFYDEYCYWCGEIGKSPTTVAKEIGISDASPTTWKKRGLAPRIETQKKLASYFGISIDELNDHTKSYPTSEVEEIQNKLFEKRKLLFDISEKATEEELDVIIKMVKGFVDG